MLNRNLFFICGAHAAGKTTILNLLKERHAIDYCGHEIGKELFYRRKFQVQNQAKEFEFEVTDLELRRDLAIINGTNLISAVETWHPGNLAYAMVRNPSSCNNLIERINKSPLIKSAYGIWLRVSADTIKKRTTTFAGSEDWAADFYTKVDSNIKQCLELLGLSENTITINAEKQLSYVTDEVGSFIQDICNKVNNERNNYGNLSYIKREEKC